MRHRLDIPVAEVREAFSYDPATGNLINRYSRPPAAAGSVAGGPSKQGYVLVGLHYNRYLAHRVVWALHHDEVPDDIDHINGDGMDNRIENLRVCTRSQNLQNQKTRKNKRSIYKGVTWHPQTQKWRARLKDNKKTVSLGLYATEHEAAAAYAKAAAEKFGEFART